MKNIPRNKIDVNDLHDLASVESEIADLDRQIRSLEGDYAVCFDNDELDAAAEVMEKAREALRRRQHLQDIALHPQFMRRVAVRAMHDELGSLSAVNIADAIINFAPNETQKREEIERLFDDLGIPVAIVLESEHIVPKERKREAVLS